MDLPASSSASAVPGPGQGGHRLAQAASPYLRAHAGNPVEWFAWGDEAFTRARDLGRPIFLSVGYAACHWCHVMAHESFEDPAIAALLNAHFVPVKVDREERPDVDAIYMRAVHAIAGTGGWPLSVFLTPDRQPFFGGTYFPPEDRWGQPGFRRVLAEVARLWQADRERLQRGADAVMVALRRPPSTRTRSAAADLQASAAAALRRGLDHENGGFGGAPKFPPCMAIEFLFRYAYRTRDQAWLRAGLLTLDHMADGGLRDHLGGGFHRYTVDGQWRIPHFEKMLYDNALLVALYTTAWQITRRPVYATIVRETLAFLDAEMRAPGGGFCAALDADSEGEEGRYYLWQRAQIVDALGTGTERFLQAYGLAEMSRPGGDGVLYRRAGGAVPDGVDLDDGALSHARALLLQARAVRPRPGRDEQVLTNWNGLALSALARAAASFDAPGWLATAQELARSLLGSLRANGELLHSRHGGTMGPAAYLDDHAFLVHGLLDLYAADGDTRHVNEADSLAGAMVARFFSPVEQAFYLTGPDRPDLIARPGGDRDDSLPAPAAAAAHALLRLAALTENRQYGDVAGRALRALAAAAGSHPYAYMTTLNALDDLESPPEEVVVAGPTASPAMRELLAAARAVWNPSRLLVQWDPTSAASHQVAETIPRVRDRGMVGVAPVAYVCRGGTCHSPITDAAELRRMLSTDS